MIGRMKITHLIIKSQFHGYFGVILINLLGYFHPAHDNKQQKGGAEGLRHQMHHANPSCPYFLTDRQSWNAAPGRAICIIIKDYGMFTCIWWHGDSWVKTGTYQTA